MAMGSTSVHALLCHLVTQEAIHLPSRYALAISECFALTISEWYVNVIFCRLSDIFFIIANSLLYNS